MSGHQPSTGSAQRAESLPRVLVAWGSRHGATRGIAERIAGRLTADGLAADSVAAKSVRDPAAYGAFVVGGSSYMFHWHPDVLGLLRHNRALLAQRPVWLFTSGPLGTDTVDAKGRSVFETTIPREMPELSEAVHPRDIRVFFGALDLTQPPQGLAERFTRMMPAAREAMPQGDFRDWAAIDAWADSIAEALGGHPAGA